ncbi:hypothetical protein F5148DRAFT_7244 [Russula earlei]|uniref:Uncharacterized protein n=1 Tax=Russula earlei TaxID=71964 RepID=A0ACC0UP45_9AGAM|nr:hypothetical protein F5148DRAFT_7244 [Russula earlei]
MAAVLGANFRNELDIVYILLFLLLHVTGRWVSVMDQQVDNNLRGFRSGWTKATNSSQTFSHQDCHFITGHVDRYRGHTVNIQFRARFFSDKLNIGGLGHVMQKLHAGSCRFAHFLSKTLSHKFNLPPPCL